MFNVLIIDDDKNIRFVFSEILRSAGYTPHEAKNAAEAFEILDKEYIDIAIVDIMMPGIDGYEFTKQLRDCNMEFPILMVSAKQLPEDRKIGFLAGIDDFMSKPVDPDELLLHIKALLRRYKIVNEKKISIGDVLLDYDSFSVKKGDQIQVLPQKEFLLLYKLLSAPGKIFTKIQLMEEIWGVDCDTTPETITVHIGRLRKRFEEYTEFEIDNVRGLGYRAVKKI